MIGRGGTGEIRMSGYVYAENLPRPKEVTLTITANVHHTSVSLEDLRNLPPAEGPEDEDGE